MKRSYLLKISFLLLVLYWIYKAFYPYSTEDLGNNYIYADDGEGCAQYIIKNKNYIVPEKVVAFDVDENYIIATRIIVEIYGCCDSSVDKCTGKNITMFMPRYLKRLEYWIINKKKDIAYVSYDKSKLEIKLQELGSLLKFTKNNYTHHSEMTMQDTGIPFDKICEIQNSSENKALKHIIRL